MPSKRTGAKRPAPKTPAVDFPRGGTPPDAHGFPHYAAIGRANADHRRHYTQTLADRRSAAAAFRARATPAAWRRFAAGTRTALAGCLGVCLNPEPDPQSPPVFLRASTLVPDGVALAGPSVFSAATAVATVYNLPAAGLDGGDIELFTLKCPSVGGPYPTLLWLPRSGDCYTGAQSPEAAAREFGHTLAAAGWLVVIPKLPALEQLSIPTAKRRLLEGSSAVGAIVAEAARAITAALTLPGRRAEDTLWAGGAEVGGLTALFLAALDRRVAAAAALELPRLTDATVHEALTIPRINATADLTTVAALSAPGRLLLDRAQPLCDARALQPLYRRLNAAPRVQSCASAPALLAALAAFPQQSRTAQGARISKAAKAALRQPDSSKTACIGAPRLPRRRFDIARPANLRAAAANWPKRQADLRREVRAAFGLAEPHLPLKVVHVGRTELKDSTRDEYHLTTEPDCIINLTWLRPRGFDAPAKNSPAPRSGRKTSRSAAGALTPLPAILCLPGSGSDVGKVEGQFAHEVIARGWNAIIIDARVALYPFHPGIAERRAMITQSVHDLVTAAQWVFEQPGLDVRRVGCMGVSQGGTHSWMLPMLEPRIAAAAPVCGVCTWQSLIDNVRDERYDSAWRSFLDSHSIYYFIPGILDGFEQQDLCALIAPRPFALIGADHDNCFPLDGMRAAARDLAHFYRALGAPAAFKYIEFQGEHSMPRHTRESAYNFIAAAFRRV